MLRLELYNINDANVFFTKKKRRFNPTLLSSLNRAKLRRLLFPTNLSFGVISFERFRELIRVAALSLA